MTDKIEIRFDERWKEGLRAKGGVTYIVDPKSGRVTILGYKDGQVVSAIETNLEEIEVVFDQGIAAYDKANNTKMEFVGVEE